MRKLLNTTLKPFAIYSLLVLSLSIPAYFYIINYIWQHELDKHHEVTRSKVEQELNKLNLQGPALESAIAQFNKLQLGSTMKPDSGAQVDSVYSYYRFDAYHNDVEQFRGLSTRILIEGKPYSLVMETNMEESEETVLAIAVITFVFFMLLLAGLIFLSRRISQLVWQPFYSTLHHLKNFDLDAQRNIPFQNTNIREFEELHQALHQLIEQNIEAFRRQKEFTENISHELQTPLAVLKSRIDILLQDTSLSGEQAEQIAALNNSLSRISRINKNLLLLAKMNNKHYADNEPINMGEVLNESIDFLSAQIESGNISVRRNIQESINVTANKSLIEILLLNLLLNAVRHNQEAGALIVELHAGRIIIANTGLSALSSEKIFQRFISSSSESPGSGLGLAIVKEICSRYAWKIEYRFENGLHFFTLSFKFRISSESASRLVS